VTQYKPDRFVLLRIELTDSVEFKVLAGWSGGYLVSDSWKINSGIESYYIDDNGYYHFIGYSGSEYKVHPDQYGISMAFGHILSTALDHPNVSLVTLEFFEEETNAYKIR